MPRSSSSVFEVALRWTTKQAGATDPLTLNRHSTSRTKPFSRDQRFRRFGGT